MGGARRRDPRSRLDRGSSNTSVKDGLGNSSLDSDDDFPMRGAEHDANPAPSNQRRGRRGANGTDNRTNTNTKNNRSERPPKSRNPFGALIDNPFRELSPDRGVFRDDQGSKSQRRGKHNHTHSHQSQDNQDLRRRRNEQRRPNTQYRRPRDKDNIPDVPPNRGARNNNRVPHWSSVPTASPSSRSTSPARLTRFCTECSAVRRANIALRDYCASALARAVEVLDRWSEEVGVGVGSGDEMDWQPEPVVRVLILTVPAATGTTLPLSTSTTTTSTNATDGAGTGTRRRQPDGGWSTENPLRCAYTIQRGASGGFPGGGALGGHYGMDDVKQPPRGFIRPETPSPAFSAVGGMNGNSIWQFSGSVAGAPTTGNASVLGQGGVGQGRVDARGSRVHDAFGLQSVRMLSPPNSPFSHMIS